MKLDIVGKGENKRYYLAKSVRENGKVLTKRILRIGSYSELIKQYEDPEAYCRQVVAEANEELKKGIVTVKETYNFKEKLDETFDRSSKVTFKNVGYLYIENVIDKLKINEFIEKSCKNKKFKYSLLDAIKLLTFSRILDPRSKLSTYDKSDMYLKEFDFKLADIYRSLDVINEISDNLQIHLYQKSEKIHERNKTILYYDCTNYFFETEVEDADIDDVNEVIYGLRKYGLSKEHRPNPIVQMGLFMDKDGIPIAFCINPGNTNEQTTAIPLEKKIIKEFSKADVIYCSDAGLGSASIKQYNSKFNRYYLVTQSLKKINKKEREYIFEDLNWRFFDKNPANLNQIKNICNKIIKEEALTDEEQSICQKDMIYKEFPLKDERLIVTFSISSFLYQHSIFLKQVDRASKYVKSNHAIPFSQNDTRRFISTVSTTGDGVVAENKQQVLDTTRMKKESQYHGFYAMATNLDLDVGELMNINRGRWKIENNFRVIKTNFKARPVYLYNPKRINAHFMICFLALLVFRLIKTEINSLDPSITDQELIDTLKNMNIHINDKGLGKPLYTSSIALEKLEEIYNLGLNYKVFLDTQIQKFKK